MAERVGVFWTNEEAYEMQLRLRSEVSGSVVVVDLREEYRIYAGSRFTVYALYPECNVSITLQPNAGNDLVTLAVGKSIVNRSSQADIGTILLGFGGGGQKAAGTCQVPHDDVDDVVCELIQKIEA